MRHQVKNTRINRNSAQLKALIRSLSTALIVSGTIETTKVKAKVTASAVDKMIARTKGKDKMNAIRYLKKHLYGEDASKIILDELHDKYKDRQSGFTRIVKLGARPGDGAEKVVLQLV
ncbi:50S ribosomal protein L17 [Candidatus Gracilibacteria bacterium]|nr:50S ribosomal protein L17 [Candidatus Gracilibacteria bacterium]